MSPITQLPIVINSMHPLIKDPAFTPFPKLARLSREIIVTEKIDGTNASVTITRGDSHTPSAVASWFDDTLGESRVMLAGSRLRWITPENDNYGFAQWVRDNQQELRGLGDGTHFGEWWGSGVNRGYGFRKGERFFSLFNTYRWCLASDIPWVNGVNHLTGEPKLQDRAPACCGVVPILYRGPFDMSRVGDALATLKARGSYASAGFRNPEGVVVFHTAAQVAFKKTLDKDDHHKGQ